MIYLIIVIYNCRVKQLKMTDNVQKNTITYTTHIGAYASLCGKKKFYRDKDIIDLVNMCKHYIEDLKSAKCLCKYIEYSAFSDALLYFVCKKCQIICNYCILSLDKIYKLIQHFNYKDIKSIINFDRKKMMSSEKIIVDIDNIKRHLLVNNKSIPIDEIYYLLLDLKVAKMNNKTLLLIIDYLVNCDMQKSKNSIQQKIMELLLNDEKFVIDNNGVLSRFIVDLIKNNKIDLFKFETIHIFFKSDALLKISFESNLNECVKYIVKKAMPFMYIQHILIN